MTNDKWKMERLSSRPMAKESSISLSTPIMSLHKHGIARLGQLMSRKLALAVANFVDKPDANQAIVEDLLHYLPLRYEDRSNMTRIANLHDGVEASLELYVRVAGGFQVGKNRGPKQPPLYIFEITASDPDNTGRPVVIWWFVSGRQSNRIIAYHKQRFTRGARFIAFGKWEWDARRNTYSLRLNKPDELEMLPGVWTPELSLLKSLEEKEEEKREKGEGEINQSAIGNRQSAMEEDEDDDEFLEDDSDADPSMAAIHVGRRVPVYRKLGQFRAKRLREIVHAVLDQIDEKTTPESLPSDLIARKQLINRARAFKRIHFPAENDSLVQYERARSPAHLRLIFEEFFWLSLAIGIKRGERAKEPKGTVIEITDRMRERIFSVLPFKLTNAQERVMRRIFEDLQSDAPMNRLVQGDVGSGKTAVALLAMLAAMENGYQTALMVPTEILAEQHACNVKRLLAQTPYRIELLTGSLRVTEKRKLHKDIEAGDIHACIGTHALIQEAVRFNKLGLVVIDEQHRFGVLQRAELMERGYNPDVLVMTATPIPRSLAMTVYGDLDVSVIDELPPGRTPIKTVVCGEDQRKGVYKGVEREVELGRQIYIIYPLVEESEKMDLKDATRMYEHLRDRVFSHYTIGLLHGKMKSADKEEVMRKFVSGETQILVSTTVVEVGVDVPNASLMIIEHAERFGLSQLHQLRGRVGRGAEKSYCVLLASDKQTAVARERLGIMEESSDGFRIAEKDLELRGPGDVMGTRQSGIPAFRVGNIVRDLEILEDARREVEYYLNRMTRETSELIEKVKTDVRYGLASVG
jgi:ATP-dependent DNA helicase RecG